MGKLHAHLDTCYNYCVCYILRLSSLVPTLIKQLFGGGGKLSRGREVSNDPIDLVVSALVSLSLQSLYRVLERRQDTKYLEPPYRKMRKYRCYNVHACTCMCMHSFSVSCTS